MRRFLTYVFWNFYYMLVMRSATDLDWHLKRIARVTWKRPFRPHVQHSDAGSFWTVWFSPERSYTQSSISLLVDVHFDMKDLRVVGFDIYDKDLEQLVEEEQLRGTQETEQADG